MSLVKTNHRQDISQFTEEEKVDLAKTLQELTIRYDNIFQTSFPYSAGMHQAPVNGEPHPEWHWHMHFYPPLLRSASIKKFMVGYEMFATPQRDITAENAAEVIRNQSKTHYKKTMFSKETIRHSFHNIFQEDAQLYVKSPGRINIIGEHTDYNKGLVLPAAIDKYIYVAISQRKDRQIKLYSEGYKEQFTTNLEGDMPPDTQEWVKYIIGVSQIIQSRTGKIQGFNMYIDGDVPLGAGLSSSAALTCELVLV